MYLKNEFLFLDRKHIFKTFIHKGIFLKIHVKQEDHIQIENVLVEEIFATRD